MNSCFNSLPGKVLLSVSTAALLFSPGLSAEITPERPLPAEWNSISAPVPVQEQSGEWWKLFGDSVLDSLESIAVSNSYDLAAAARRIKIAQAQLNNARAGYFPQIGVSAGWNKAQVSGLTTGRNGEAVRSSYFDAGLSASWEVDVFGKIYSRTKEQKANVKLTRADYAGAILSLTANVASSYFQLRVWQQELTVADEHAVRQKKVVAIAEARHEAGLSSMLDVTQARGVYYSTQASVPVLKNSIETAINSLAVLAGVYPDDIRDMLLRPNEKPSYLQLVQTGYPAELLRRRPDVVAAEQQIDADAAALGVARKAYLPSLTIDGQIGTSAHNSRDLFKSDSYTYSIAPRISWTLFDGGSRAAQNVAARETLRASVDNYNSVVMTAVEEVQNAITTYSYSVEHINAVKDVMEQSVKAYELSLDLYKKGLTPFNNVVTAQLDMLSNENTLIVAEGDAFNSLVSLCKALGGGWTGL